MRVSDQALRNREHWDRTADEYQAAHASQLNVDELVWGTFSIPEAEVDVLGDVAGKDVLELGCGAAQWSIPLAHRGARVVGLDNSARQLEHARRLQAEAGLEFPLVHASAEDVPLPDASFDVVLSDHGAFSWCDPAAVVPEAARLLRMGGLLAFNVASPFLRMCYDEERDAVGEDLNRSYFELGRLDEGGGAATFNLTDGEWIALLRAHGFVVEALTELGAPETGSTTYGDVPLEWARNWPADQIWQARKQ